MKVFSLILRQKVKMLSFYIMCNKCVLAYICLFKKILYATIFIIFINRILNNLIELTKRSENEKKFVSLSC